MVFSLWIGFGQPKPPPPVLPFSTSGCSNTTLILSQSAPTDTTEYFWLYRISYLWYAPLGFLISFFTGWIFSAIFELCGAEVERTIYLDAKQTMINADLFSPPIARRIRLKNAEYLEKQYRVCSTFGKGLFGMLNSFFSFSRSIPPMVNRPTLTFNRRSSTIQFLVPLRLITASHLNEQSSNFFPPLFL